MYNEFFGFREKPFNITPDPRFCYANSAYEEAYASLLYGIQERKGFIALTGEVGTGKTTLLRRLIASLAPPNEFVYLCYSTPSFEEFLTFICVDLGLEVEGKGYLEKIQSLNNFLLEVLKKGGTGVLLVDEAQNLGETVLENLRLLSNIETATEKLLQIVLVGQPELERKLAHPNLRQLKQRIAVQCRLDRLKEREVGPFIFSRLRTAGYEKKDLFPPETIQRIALYSRATPRLINILCDNALLVAYSAAQQVISPEMVDEVARDLQMRSDVPPREERRLQSVARQDGESSPQERTQDLNFANEIVANKAVTPRVQTPLPVSGTWTPLPSSRGAFFYIGIGVLLAFLLLPAFGVKLENTVDILREALISWTYFGSQKTANPTTPKELNPHAPVQPPTNVPLPQAVPLPSPADALAEPPRPATQGLEETRDMKKFEQQANAGGQNSEARVSSPPENKKEQENPFVIVQSGTTISMIVQKTYGSLTPLAVDLVKEFNPTVQNLDQIHAGEKIWLPPLTRETLLRKDVDGSSRLIVGSFRSLSEAEQFQQKVKGRGFTVKVSPQKISARISLYRVEIEGLQDLAAIDRAWDLVDIHKNEEKLNTDNAT